jgi:hypothetical protein
MHLVTGGSSQIYVTIEDGAPDKVRIVNTGKSFICIS